MSRPPAPPNPRTTLRVRREPLSALLATQLRAAVFSGEMQPGARLTEDAVAAQAQVSKSTVREALRILARDGLVKLVPMSGARVTVLELRDVREISEARLALIRCDQVEALEVENIAPATGDLAVGHLVGSLGNGGDQRRNGPAIEDTVAKIAEHHRFGGDLGDRLGHRRNDILGDRLVVERVDLEEPVTTGHNSVLVGGRPRPVDHGAAVDRTFRQPVEHEVLQAIITDDGRERHLSPGGT